MPVPDRDSAEFFVAPGTAGVGHRDAPAGGLVTAVSPVTPVGPDISRCIQRHQYPEDLCGAVMFLLSPGANFISGQTLNVDGGQHMH